MENSETVFMAVAGKKGNLPLNPRLYSSFLRLQRVLAWINRFVDNCRKPKEDRTAGELLSGDLKQAEIQIIRHTQITEFTDEWKALSCRKPLPSNSKLFGLQPKLDDDGLMRCYGRLAHAELLPYEVRYPVILPRGNWVTKLIVKEYHERGNHSTGTRHSQQYPLDTGCLQNVKKYENGRRDFSISPTEIEDILANNGTIANIETEAISASIC